MRHLAALSIALLLGCAGSIPSPMPGTSPAHRPGVSPSRAVVASPTPSATSSAPPTHGPVATGPATRSSNQPGSPGDEPSPSASPATEAYSVNLYGEGDFVSEYTKYYCLPAAMQVMINIMSDGPPDTTRETQDRLYELAAELDGVVLPERVRDVEPEGWANALNAEGYGPYDVAAEETLEGALRLAARQLRLTGKPVGLLTWRGAHSWVMSGFEASADPLLSDDFEVTDVWIQDVWWPRISDIWGESDPPNTLVPIERLPQDYLKYRRPYGRFPDKDGRYVLVIPLEDEPG